MNFEVSVIIPVYNAEEYILKAVRSVMIQPEVKEIIIVDDGSTDTSCTIIKDLKNEDYRIHLYQHELGENRGRSATRNLGIQKAGCNFIAFLDADDFYLSERFKKDKEVFKRYQDADGVYNAIGAEFYKLPEERERLDLTTLKKEVPPEKLFYEMWPKGYNGSFSIDGLTVKKEIFEKTGLFNEHLEVAEDTELFIKMSLRSRLYPGELKNPVSKRGIHSNNVTHLVGEDIYTRNYYRMYYNLLIWASRNGRSLKAIDYFWERLHQHHRMLFKKESVIDALKFWGEIGYKVPNLFKTRRFLKAFPPYSRFKKT